jgi:hypothetical protein
MAESKMKQDGKRKARYMIAAEIESMESSSTKKIKHEWLCGTQETS